MPSRMKIDRLPSQVLRQLHDRLIESAYGDLEVHSLWLKESGYEISKSAVGRYSEILRQAETVESTDEQQQRSADFRMRCLEVASVVENVTDPIAIANELYFWVTTGRRP